MNVTASQTRRLKDTSQRLEPILDALLTQEPLDGELPRPKRLTDAMRYSVLGGGKRLRPVLLLETACLFGRNDAGVLTAGAALEMIHCYSLIHDDLPAMDDDDLRRGRPTLHKAYDEATAILAGDALLTLAFDVISRDEVHADPRIRLELCRDLARASGLGGMAGGQMLDLESEGRARSEAEIRTLQAMKTGALLRYACRTGARMANADQADVTRMTRFGEIIGLAFQIADDLLDLEASAETMGKATGKDAAAGKATLVGLMGAEPAKDELEKLLQEAKQLLAPFGEAAQTLTFLADFIAQRTH